MSNRLPSYSLRKATGQARVWLNGRDHYLGLFDPPESRQRYATIISDLAAGMDIDPFKPSKGDGGPTVNELVLAFCGTRSITTERTVIRQRK